MLRTGDVVRVGLVLLALGSVASRGSACSAGTVDPLAPRVHVSANARFAVAIVPKAPAEGRAPWQRGGAHFYEVDPHGEPVFVGWFDLVNEVAPTDALVSDDGRFLVTFGDREHGDDGEHAVVLYRTDGSLIRSLAPADILTPTDLAGVAGRWRGSWREGQLIDESGTVLVLRIHRCGAHDACLEESPQVAFRLDDGAPLHPVRNLLPHKVPGSRLVPGEAPEGARPFHPDDSHCPDEAAFARAPLVPFERLGATAADLAAPPYDIVAVKARLQGSVVLELFVERGAVSCVRTIRDLPFRLGRGAREAALTWRFPAAPAGAAPFRTVVKIEYGFYLTQPDPEP